MEDSQPTDSAPLSLKPATRQKLTATVAVQLLEEMQRRGLAPGTRMPSERELMAALGVGRSTIREALNGLAMLGVVEIRHGQGTFILDPKLRIGAQNDDLLAAIGQSVSQTLLEARRPVEVEIARLAAQRRSEQDLARLEDIIGRQEAAVREERSGARPAAQFHLALADAAHNEILAEFIASIMKLLVERGPQLEALDGYIQWEVAEHRGLLDAVRLGDPVEAARRMDSHLTQMEAHHHSMNQATEVATGA
jgi:GntR family transcriptional repressor for pyruvate dehydrogenase complex